MATNERDDKSLRDKLASGKGKQLNVVIPADLHKRLKLQAVVEESSMSDIVAAALLEYLSDK